MSVIALVEITKIYFLVERHTGVTIKKGIRYFARFSAAISILTFSAFSQASYWGESICSHYVSGTDHDPGSTFTAGVSVSAQRTSTSIIPVNFYFSETPSLTNTSQYLGNTNTLVQQPGSYCSSVVNKTLTMPAHSVDQNCMESTSAYILFKTGDDVKSTPINLTPSGKDLPIISSFSPLEGRVNSVVTITGDNFDENTAVYFGGTKAASWLTDSTEIRAAVPEGASNGNIAVKREGDDYQFCAISGGVSAEVFTVKDEYCESGALTEIRGRFKHIATNEFSNNFSSSSECPAYSNYTEDTTMVAKASLGTDKTFQFKFDTCGTVELYKIFKAYVDWNIDGDFDDPGEFVHQWGYVLNDLLYEFNLSIPNTAVLGMTRMRVITATYSGAGSLSNISSCGNYQYGETLDFNLEVQP